MRFRNTDQDQTLGMQVAPMIDVVFLLLIFFLLTWNFSRETELDISVPAADQGQDPKRRYGEMIINIHADGRIVVHSREMDENQLLANLQEIASIREDQSVILRCDQTAESKHMLRVLNICHKAKIYNIAFATRDPNEISQ